jgi:glycerol-3-phosphate dehydrogenase (NAD(P)+)
MEIGAGMTLQRALEGKETIVEGVASTESAHELAIREGVEMPIVQAVYRTLFLEQPAAQAIGELMQRELRSERD